MSSTTICGTCCIICANALTFDDISALKCGHTFHGGCIKKWIQQAKNCPTCRIENVLTDITKLYVDAGPTHEENCPNRNPLKYSINEQGAGPSVEVFGQDGQQQMGEQQPTEFGPYNEVLPPPLAPSQPREWHASVVPALRTHMIGKLVTAIFPSPDSAAIHTQRIKGLITYARNVEKDIFELAPDKEAYYLMLAEKYKIHKEIQEKKNCRLNELRLQQQQHPAN